MSEYVAHEETRGALRLRIIADSDPINPRKEFDHAGTVMCCDHKRYDLSDEDAHKKAATMIRASRDYREKWEDEDDKGEGLDFRHGPDLWKAIQRCTDIISLPCYLYDHSGITMSTGRFSCPWDSGQVGFIAMAKPDILEAYCKPKGARLSTYLKQKAYALLEAQVKEYDQYLTGDVYGYVVDRVDGEALDSMDDSCWGFFGLDYATTEGKEALEYIAGQLPDLANMPADAVEEMAE